MGTISSVDNIQHDTTGGYLGTSTFLKKICVYVDRRVHKQVFKCCGQPMCDSTSYLQKRFELLVLCLVNVGFQPLPLKRDWNRCGRMCLRTHDLKHRVRAACHPPNFVNIIKLCMTYYGPHISCMCSPLEWQNPFFNWKINFFFKFVFESSLICVLFLKRKTK